MCSGGSVRDGGLELQHSHSLRQLTWHSRGDYFATVAPTGNTQVLPRWLSLRLLLKPPTASQRSLSLQQVVRRCQLER